MPTRAPAIGRPRLDDGCPSFRGGLNTVADESEVAEDEVRRADNARLTQFGAIEKRLGSRYLHTAAIGGGAPVRGGAAWSRATSTTELAIAGGTLYTGTYGVPMTWTSRGGSFDAAAVPSFAAFRHGATACVYVADGAGKISSWDGSSLTMRIAGSVNQPIAQLCVYNQRLYGITGQDETLYASGLSDGDTLGVAGSGGVVATVQTFGAQRLTALFPLGASLLLYHVAAISVFTGYTQDDIAIDSGTQGLTNDVGTIAPRSIVPLEDVHLFLTDRGVYAATPGGVTPVSNPIEETLAALDASQWARVWAVHNRRYREVLFYLPDVGIYAYNYRLQAWTGPWADGYVSPVSHCAWESRDAESRPIWLVGTAAGFVKRGDAPNTTTDNVAADGTAGTAYTWTVRCRRLYHGDPSTEKSYRFAFPLIELRGSTATTLSWTSQAGSGTTSLASPASLWGGSTWGGSMWSSGSQTVRQQIGGRGNYVDVTLTDTGTSGRPSLARLAIEAFLLGRRG